MLSQIFGVSDKVAVNTCGQFERDLYRFTEAKLTQLTPDELVSRFAVAGSPEVMKEQINGEGSALMK